MTYKATTQDVLDVLGTRIIIRAEIIREIGNRLWVGTRTFRPEVSAHSVDKALEALMSTGEVTRLKGSHWTITWSSYPETTFYMATSAKQAVAERLDQQERDNIRDRAEDQAKQVVLRNHYDEWRQLRDATIAAIAEPDHASLWEES